MKVKVLLFLLLILCYDFLLFGQDTITDGNDENKVHREKILTRCNEYLNAKEYREAVDFLTKEISTQDVKADDYELQTTGYIYGMRGLNYYYLQEYDSALNDLKKSIKILPEWSGAYFFRGLVKFDLHKDRAALADYLKAIKLEPVYNQIYFASGNAYLRLQEYQDAITAYNKYIGFDSSLAVSYYNRAVAKDNLNDYQGAVADLVKAIELNPDPYYVSHLSYIYFRHNDIDAAIDITKYGIEKDSARAFLYSNLGRFYLEKGDYDNAEMNFSKCVEIDNDNYQTALNISELYFNKNDKINSKKYLDQAKKLEPRLNNGLDGIEEIEKEQPGQCKYSGTRKETLQKMFEELK